MGRFFLVGFFYFFISCSQQIVENDLKLLEGYWEIEKVTLPDGNIKTYNVNMTIDYIKMNGLKGYRKKVKPKFNGTYDTSNDAEPFIVLKKGESFQLEYKNDLSHWTESLVELSKDNFSVLGEDGTQYDYKRYEPINVGE